MSQDRQRNGERDRARAGGQDRKSLTKPIPTDRIWLTTDQATYHVWESSYRTRAGTIFGEAASELGADEDIDEPDEDEPEYERGSWLYELELEKTKADLKRYREILVNRGKLYDDIFMHISPASEQRVRLHEDYMYAEGLRSTRILWDIIRETHLAKQFVGRIGVIGKRRELYQLYLGTRTIYTHARIFQECYDALIAMGDSETSEQAAADAFLKNTRIGEGASLRILEPIVLSIGVFTDVFTLRVNSDTIIQFH